MKKSMFNIEVDDGEYKIIYNTLSFSMIKIHRREWEDVSYLRDEDICFLSDMGLLIDNSVDEFYLWKRYSQLKNKKNSASTFVIAPTLKCNAHCWYCFENDSKKDTFSEKRIIETINAINSIDSNRIKIIWFGGEPTLALNIIEQIINSIDQSKIIDSRLISNGFLLNSSLLKKLMELKITSIQVTLDAVFEEYDKCKQFAHCSGCSAFEIVINNIKEALYLGFAVSIRVNVNPMNKSNALETIEYCIKTFAKYPRFSIYAAPLDFGDAVPLEEQADAWFDCLKQIWTNKKYKKVYKELQNKYHLNYNIKGCELINGVKVVGPDHDYLCHRELGQNSNIEYEEFFSHDCTSCSILPICNGGCQVNKVRFGLKFGCSPMKYIIEKVVRLYYKEIIGG